MDSLKALGLASQDLRPDEENVAQYEVYCAEDASRAECEHLLLSALDITAQCTSGRIWQQECFSLTLSTQSRPSWWTSGCSTSSTCLWGATAFGDNVEDEWFIVALLQRITYLLPGLAARVWDNDGEFLLIEAAYQLPRWLKPETASHRLWLYGGKVHIVPLPTPAAPALPSAPTCQQALSILRSETFDTAAKPEVQAAIGERTAALLPPRTSLGVAESHCASNSDHDTKDSGSRMHTAEVRVPLLVAHVLREEPQLVAPAVGAFYNRDPPAMKAASRMTTFPPVDMVTVCVRFNRTLYAQLKLQEFQEPTGYPLPLKSSAQYRAAELGMKLTAGFEMMMAAAPPKDTSSPKQVWAKAGPDDPSWAEYVVGVSSGDDRRDTAAKLPMKRSGDSAARSEAMRAYVAMAEVLSGPVPHVEQLCKERPVMADFQAAAAASRRPQKPDSDAWLADSSKELEDELLRVQETSAPRKADSSDCQSVNQPVGQSVSNADVAGLDRLSRRMQTFLGETSSYEGADSSARASGSGSGIDRPLELDPSKFLSQLSSMLGLVHERPGSPEEDHSSDDSSFYGDPDSSSSGSYSASDQGTGGRHRAHNENAPAGVEVRGSDQQTDTDSDDEAGPGGFTDQYTQVLEEQLAQTAMGKSFERTADVTAANAGPTAPEGSQSVNPQPEGSHHKLKPVDVDLNLITNMLASFESQHGLPGPMTNMAGILGLPFPPPLAHPDSTDTAGGGVSQVDSIDSGTNSSQT